MSARPVHNTHAGHAEPRAARALRPAQGERTDRLWLAGYAALFNIADAARDTIVPGAFAHTLAGRSQPLPLLWQHRPDRRIGVVELAEEDRRGLRVIARIDNADDFAAGQLLARAANGLSFGYRARAWRRLPQGRLLEAIDLLEVSLVTQPLQAAARVHLVQ